MQKHLRDDAVEIAFSAIFNVFILAKSGAEIVGYFLPRMLAYNLWLRRFWGVMEKIQFKNKIWLPASGRILDRILNISAYIYLLGNVVIMLAEKPSFKISASALVAIVFIIWTKRNLKKKGIYIETDCIITFSDNMLIWEYPDIDFRDGRGMLYVKYLIRKEDIVSVAMSSELNSVRLKCNPTVECTNKNGKTKIINYKSKGCILITYNYNIYDIAEKYKKYMDIIPEKAD